MGAGPGNPYAALDRYSGISEDYPIVVRAVFVGRRYQTEVWMSEKAAKDILSQCDDPVEFKKKLGDFAQAGFWHLSNRIVRHEPRGKKRNTHRVRHNNSTWFRLLGFFDDNKKVFIALAGCKKKNGDTYTAAQEKLIEWVSDVKECCAWKRSGK